MKGTLLLYTSDDSDRRERVRDLLRGKGHQVDTADSLESLGNLLAQTEYDVALLFTPEQDGLTVLTYVKHEYPETEVILSTDTPKVETAVAAMQEGAFHFMAFPDSVEKLDVLVQKALEKRMLSIELSELREAVGAGRGIALIGKSPAIQSLKKTMRRVAPMDVTVLLRGETGTGKELVSRLIHAMSPRADKRFLAVNCGALSDELLASELFGHERGAFTGAVSEKAGLFEAASGGTILLDEVGETPPQMQVKLLRVLQEKTILRVGGTKELAVDVRVLAATNRSLTELVGAGEFRQDLYYRLDVFKLRLPPLRERRDDIPLFCRHFLDKYGAPLGKTSLRVSEEVMHVFMQYSFPGNVRELENVLERAVVLCEGTEIRREHLPQRMRATSRTPLKRTTLKDLPTLAELEERYIDDVLELTADNKTEAAKILGINRASLWRKLKRKNSG